ncbi:MAG: bifunctional riboflavin kinase/FMN adenylyltransferase [Coriobacteriales bacterium]|nr:bifunctional riboflavin kinase/FMN adenylyltransferase [Coriobacteriales bacterium]
MAGEAVCAMGVFDGFHRGHQFIIQQARAEADRLGLPLIVVTFDRDPDEFFAAPQTLRKLLTNADRLALLAQGCLAPAAAVPDEVLALTFDQQLARQEPEDFLNAVLSAHCQPRALFVGADFRFGHRAAGTVADLKRWGWEHDCRPYPQQLLTHNGQTVSATAIRDALEAGRLALANELLTRPYYVHAQVVPGRHVGHELGFPTANLVIQDSLTRPADGVYSGIVTIEDDSGGKGGKGGKGDSAIKGSGSKGASEDCAQAGGQQFRAAISVGVPATFSSTAPTIEAHLIDFEGELYGRYVTVSFHEFLRPMQRFASVEELIATVQTNIEQARSIPLP